MKWQGKCDSCGEWNTLKQIKNSALRQKSKIKNRGNSYQPVEVVELDKVSISSFVRIKSNIGEFDRVLGGGLVPGSIAILGGDPGIGKSTLLLQIATSIDNVLFSLRDLPRRVKAGGGRKQTCLYISGEESAEQIKLRSERLGLKSKTLKLYSETSLDEVIETIQHEKPTLVVVDSIQTIYSNNYPSTAGSIIQVRECALELQQLAKSTNTAVILVGHVTKDGTVAGPRTLEHLVDVVLYLEGERFHGHRILRGTKNRFGSVDEIGIFEMTERGMKEVSNPSKIFLEERRNNIPGTVVTATVEGSRALLVEVQALTSQTVFGYPQRRTSGFDLNRLQLLLAVLQKRAGINTANQDVFVNIVGGIKILEPAVDLAVALAVAGSVRGKVIDPHLCIFGEVGLSGEVRHVSFEAKRKAEAERLGFNKFVRERTILDVVRRYCV